MYFDNQIFNVNGHGDEGLMKTLELVFLQRGSNTSVNGMTITRKHGLILHWCKPDSGYGAKDITELPSLSLDEIFYKVKDYLGSDEADEAELGSWDGDTSHDGDNSAGWRVYVEDWGHVANQWSAICGIKKIYAWHGK